MAESNAMPPLFGIGNSPSVQLSIGGGHGNHDATTAAPNTNGGQSFSTALAQAVSQSPGANGTRHSSGNASVASLAHGDSHPRHFRIGESAHDGGRSVHEIALGLRAYRQQLIAANIANADTPGYQATDIDFQEALRIARAAADAPPLALMATSAGHVVGQAGFSAPPYPVKYHTPRQPSADGNTVELDVERSKFAENGMMYEFSLDRVSGHFKHMMEMLQNLKD